VNLCADVVDSVVERLAVSGFAFETEEGSTRTRDQLQEETIWRWWQDAKMATVAGEAHKWASRDGEAFILIDWDVERGRPRFILHPRYVDAFLTGGSGATWKDPWAGYGMWMEYPFNDYLAEPIRAVKRWYEWEPETKRNVQRQTVYYADRIEKYILDGGQWLPFMENVVVRDDAGNVVGIADAPWPTPWVDAQGNPLGIPVAHVHNPGSKSDLDDVIPLQDGLNKQWLDLLATADSTGFRLLFTFGFVMTTDGKEPNADSSNVVKITPGSAYGTSKPKNEVDVKDIEPGDLKSLLMLEERIVFRIADVSDTPLSRFQTTHMIAAEGTLKQQEAPYVSKIMNRQTVYGDAWAWAMQMAVKLAMTFGQKSFPEAQLRTIWKPAELRSDKDRADTAKVHAELGVPEEFLWSEQLGYSAEQIAKMKDTEEWKDKTAMRKNMLAIGGELGDQGEGDQDQEDQGKRGEETGEE